MSRKVEARRNMIACRIWDQMHSVRRCRRAIHAESVEVELSPIAGTFGSGTNISGLEKDAIANHGRNRIISR